MVERRGRVTLKTNRSESIAKLVAALSKAQGEMSGAAKSSDNPFFRSKYADLASVWDACRQPLSKHGLAIIQTPHPAEKVESGLYETRAIVETLLAHESGEWISSVISLPVLGPELKGGGRGEVNAQSFGSALTYARRYSLAAMVGVYQEDDDGEGVGGNGRATVETMPESALIDHVRAIQAAVDTDELKRVYLAAYKAAGKDESAQKKLIAAKDARKASIEAGASKVLEAVK